MNKKLSIICIGDSITYGLCASSREKSYPHVLGEILGEEYSVKNFGRNGATAYLNSDFKEDAPSPYKKTPEYKEAISEKADVVIIMLGMNDANPTHFWNLPSGAIPAKTFADYKAGLSELIDDFKALGETTKIVLLETTPMTRKEKDGFTPEYVLNFNENLAKIRSCQQSLAKEKGLCFIKTAEFLDLPSYFYDGCHLTDIGYQKLAQIIASEIA